jgi:hypothetical protein
VALTDRDREKTESKKIEIVMCSRVMPIANKLQIITTGGRTMAPRSPHAIAVSLETLKRASSLELRRGLGSDATLDQLDDP